MLRVYIAVGNSRRSDTAVEPPLPPPKKEDRVAGPALCGPDSHAAGRGRFSLCPVEGGSRNGECARSNPWAPPCPRLDVKGVRRRFEVYNGTAPAPREEHKNRPAPALRRLVRGAADAAEEGVHGPCGLGLPGHLVVRGAMAACTSVHE